MAGTKTCKAKEMLAWGTESVTPLAFSINVRNQIMDQKGPLEYMNASIRNEINCPFHF